MKKNLITKAGILCLVSSLSLLMLSSTAVAGANTDKASKAARKKVPGASITEVETDIDDGEAVVEISLIKKKKNTA